MNRLRSEALLRTPESNPNQNASYRITIFEDNDGDVMLLREALNAAGIDSEVRVFSDGEAALCYIEGGSSVPHIIIMDMHLPKADGIAILQAVRRSPVLSEVPVVVLSSSVSSPEVELLRSYGIAEYIMKPSDLDEFMAIGVTVRNLLDPTIPLARSP